MSKNTPGKKYSIISIVDNIAHTKLIESILYCKSVKNHFSMYKLSHLRYYLNQGSELFINTWKTHYAII